jgi:hypothetical protein
MTPIEPRTYDAGKRVVFAADQPIYHPLIAWRWSDGRIVTSWRMTLRERILALLGRPLIIEVLTFGQTLQPLFLTFDGDEIEEDS